MSPALAEPVSPSFPIDTLNGDSEEDAGNVGEQAETTTAGPETTTEEEEVEPQRVVRTPYKPTASVIAEHRITHSPYRE